MGTPDKQYESSINVKRVMDREFWKERIEKYGNTPNIHKTIYDVTLSNWQRIENKNKAILEMLLPKKSDGSKYKILECGCGYGSLIDVLPMKKVDYIGIDFSQEFITLAKEKYPQNRFDKVDIRYLDSTTISCGKYDYCIARSMEGMIIENVGMHTWIMMLRQMLKVAPYIILLSYSKPDTFKVYSDFNAEQLVDPTFD